ncbi:MAG: hypothetical protein GTO45_06340 [Candidatus Aminicenantes bacterium]|nr:hypothetical protein [Candidatus Aminicenantes bacterium]NIN17705.1 hypothetical protein [Candidatus Aminicenantes bacterium]NIN41581.1 hypothetical protein [Candidatus Aminicenantes bacterium]NIN84355.1 hypothetical protein [Candidatus Aminicenantes bacterium]NIO80472.1 hypothetical protein [Candidatus Aminicenantes bacterium]
MKLSKLKDHAILRAACDSVRAYISKCHPTEPDKDPKATRKESYAIKKKGQASMSCATKFELPKPQGKIEKNNKLFVLC